VPLRLNLCTVSILSAHKGPLKLHQYVGMQVHHPHRANRLNHAVLISDLRKCYKQRFTQCRLSRTTKCHDMICAPCSLTCIGARQVHAPACT